jgi:uracil-DNA glycosylase family protein
MPRMLEPTAAALIPPEASLAALREIAAGCTACDLWTRGTQTVFGEGPPRARLMLVGEQPGDVEDDEGRPFVGPAGRWLDRALEEAGIDRADTYLTNVVKHFKWEAKGKRRIHSKPNGREIRACRPWLERELELVEPEALVLLGATAAQALLGSGFKVTEHRGEMLDVPFAPITVATVHPSSLLRAPDQETRRRETARFVDELRMVADAVTDLAAAGTAKRG